METRSFYPHGADPSVYPTVAAMRSAYLEYRYLDHPRASAPKLGPLSGRAAAPGARAGIDYIDTRTTAHAIVVVPRRVVLLRFARRATLADIARLELERALVEQTPELEALRSWPVEARLVYCDCFDGLVEAARARGIKPALYCPWFLVRWHPPGRTYSAPAFHPLDFDPPALSRYVARYSRPAAIDLPAAPR